MIFRATELAGAAIVDLERHDDERGFFARSFCQREFEAAGLAGRFVQCNVSLNARRGTLRGLHYQAAPHEEAKLVSCPRGAIHDVIVDLRAGSPTYRRWIAIELDADGGRALYVPAGFAHGFQTLRDDTLVLYQMSEFFHPESARGIRHDDPALGIGWPVADPIISARDRGYPDLGPAPP